MAKNKKRADKKKSAQKKNDKFDFDNEIVIGVTVNPENQTSKKKNKKKKKKKDKPKLKNSKAKKIITCILLTGVFITAIILFLLSPIFNITEVKVINNNKISSDTYISLSEIIIGENTFKIIKNKVVQNIKKEPYVEKVEVVRELPDKIQLVIEERTPTLMIEYAGSYAYLNNQGYILEISKEPIKAPIIKSISTEEENIKPGNRLNSEDLNKLGSVLKIIDIANGISIGEFITYIDIANSNDYIVRMDEKKKTIHLGNDSNLSNKLLYSKAIIEKEEGIEGKILANDATKNGKVVFQFEE